MFKVYSTTYTHKLIYQYTAEYNYELYIIYTLVAQVGLEVDLFFFVITYNVRRIINNI